MQRFRTDRCNVVIVSGVEYFLHMHAGELHLLPSRCPHRGGPLRLGRFEGDRVICPWHGTVVSLDSRRRKALAMVHRKYQCVILVPRRRSSDEIAARWRPSYATVPSNVRR